MSQTPDSSSPIHTLPRSAWVLLLLALGIAASASSAGLGKMVEAWLGSAEYSHAILIPFITGFLIWQRKDVLERISFQGSWGGLAVVAVGCGLLLLGRLSALLVVQQYALLIVVYGLVLGLAGWQVVKLLGMPLLLLLFMVPLPQFLMQSFSAQLQLISSQLGVALIRLLGISVYLEGNVIDLGSYKLEVAEACSGLRYLFPLMTIGLILAYFYQAPAWKRAFIFFSSIPITIFMNSFRVGAIGVLVEFWGPGMARGFVHQAEGWVVFMASLGVLLLEINLLSRIGRDRRPWRDLMGLGFPEPVPAGTRRIVHPLSRPLLASAALLAVLATGMALVPKRVEAAPSRAMFSAFPDQIGAWQGHRTVLDREFLDALKLDDYIVADYSRPGAGTVNFYAAWYNSQAAGESVHSPRSCIPGGGWRIAEFGQSELPALRIYGQPLRVNRAVIEYGSQRQLVYYWFMQRGRILTNEYLVKWYLFQDSIVQHRSDGALVRFVLPLKAGQAPQEADAELQAFIGAVAPHLDAYIPG